MKRRLAVLCVASLIAASAWQGFAQESKPARKPARGPLPTFFAQLGASDEQKDAMYVIHDEYQDKIDALATQIKQLQGERNAKLEEKLTPAQKARLQELRDEAAKAQESKKKKGPQKTPVKADSSPEPKP